VSWEELRTVLKERLEQVLESTQLAYTAPSVTNPRTIKLTSLPSNEAHQSGEFSPSAVPTPPSSVTSPKKESPGVIVQNHAKDQDQDRDQDQVHVPDQSLEILEVKAQDQGQSTEQKLEENPTPKDAMTSKQNLDGQTEAQTGSLEESAGQQEESKQGAAANGVVTESTTAETTVEDTIMGNDRKKIPISKDTLLEETPEGYHNRIKGLLNAFTSAPFTIQRVCELLSNPTEHHSNLIKYLRAVEKVGQAPSFDSIRHQRST
jgi:hypothetical protein